MKDLLESKSNIKRTYIGSCIKIASPLTFLIVFIFLIPNSTAYEVDPVWDILIYNQGDYAQFKLYGDKNQSNISLNINYYYDPDPLDLDDNTSLSATKWFSGISLNESGVGYFEVKLIKEHGFEEIGFYNLSFIFGVDVINESGNQTYTAPRFYQDIEVRYNPMYIIEENKKVMQDVENTITAQNRDYDNFKAWMIGLWGFTVFVLAFIIFRFWWKFTHNKGIFQTILDAVPREGIMGTFSRMVETLPYNYSHDPEVKHGYDYKVHTMRVASLNDKIKYNDQSKEKLLMELQKESVRALHSRNMLKQISPNNKHLKVYDKVIKKKMGNSFFEDKVIVDEKKVVPSESSNDIDKEKVIPSESSEKKVKKKPSTR